MSKTHEEIKELKQKFETLMLKLKGLTDEEIAQITGVTNPFTPTFFHNDDIFLYPNKMSLKVYKGPDRIIDNPDEPVNVRFYMKFDFDSELDKPKYKYKFSTLTTARYLICENNPHGNVDDGEFLLFEE